MFHLSIPPIIKIFAAVVILTIGIAAAATIYVIRQTNIQTNSQASEPTTTKAIWPPTQPTSSQSAQTTGSSTTVPLTDTPLPSDKPAVKKVTNPNWVYTGSSTISVLPIPNGLKNTLYLKFEAESFTKVTNINYLLTYNTGLTSIVQAAQGSLTPSGNATTKDQSTGLNAITRSVFLGTCSQNVCTTDTNMNSFKLTVTVTYLDGTTDGLTLEAFTI